MSENRDGLADGGRLEGRETSNKRSGQPSKSSRGLNATNPRKNVGRARRYKDGISESETSAYGRGKRAGKGRNEEMVDGPPGNRPEKLSEHRAPSSCVVVPQHEGKSRRSPIAATNPSKKRNPEPARGKTNLRAATAQCIVVTALASHPFGGARDKPIWVKCKLGLFSEHVWRAVRTGRGLWEVQGAGLSHTQKVEKRGNDARSPRVSVVKKTICQKVPQETKPSPIDKGEKATPQGAGEEPNHAYLREGRKKGGGSRAV